MTKLNLLDFGTGDPLVGCRVRLYQGDARVLDDRADVDGSVPLDDIDLRSPFVLDVVGFVAAVMQGIRIDVDTDVGYCGATVDWREAEGPAHDRFWEEYRAHLADTDRGVRTFWQQDHVTRRPLQFLESARGGDVEPALLVQQLAIRTGPLVRYTSPTETVIWLELETPALVRARLRSGDQDLVFYAASVRVGGRHFAAVAAGGLAEHTSYTYTIDLVGPPATGPIPTGHGEIAAAFEDAGDDVSTPDLSACVADTPLPTVRTLEHRSTELRFAFGSCRKPRGRGEDVFDAFGMSLADLDARPAFLLLTGDQIYADDIAAELGQKIGRARFACRPAFPEFYADGQGRLAARFAKMRPASQVQTYEPTDDYVVLARFPRGYCPDEIGERDTMRTRYRIANEMLWRIPDNGMAPASNAAARDPAGVTGIHAADFAEYAFLYEAAWTTPGARVLMANVPSFMTFDDHEITDDWNFSRRWVDVIHSDADIHECWPQTIADALAAYWLYQGWGNTPPGSWATDPRTAVLLQHQRLGTDALADLRQLLRDRAVSPPSTLDWHYELPTSPKILVWDLRTRRVLSEDDDRTLLMDDACFRWAENALADGDDQPCALAVVSAPILMPGLLSRTQLLADHFPDLARERDLEHWPANDSWYRLVELLRALKARNGSLHTIFALSGDVHFSYNLVAHRYDDLDDGTSRAHFPELVNCVCSPFQNEVTAQQAGQLHGIVDRFSNDFRQRGLAVREAGFWEGEQLAGSPHSLFVDNNIGLATLSRGRDDDNTVQVQLVVRYLALERGGLKALRTFAYRSAGTPGASRIPRPEDDLGIPI
ncbi:MAG: alkaline phosphatase D family protein [Myxococcales bacterium]|nr:alkaline phosphatase D family protein [Myxococcales bacterium]